MLAKVLKRSPLERRPRAGQSLSGEAIVLAFGALASQAVTLVSLAVLARLLTKREFGTYSQLGIVFSIVSSLFIAGVPSAPLYYLRARKSDTERRRWVFDTYLVMGAIGAIGPTGLVVVRHTLADALSNLALAQPLAYYAPLLLFAPVSGATAAALVGQGRSRLSALLTSFNAATLSGATIIAALSANRGGRRGGSEHRVRRVHGDLIRGRFRLRWHVPATIDQGDRRKAAPAVRDTARPHRCRGHPRWPARPHRRHIELLGG